MHCCLAKDNLLGFPASATLKVLLTWVSPGSIQMMLLQVILRKKCFPAFLKNGFEMKLYHVPSLAWDNWVVLYQPRWHPKRRFLMEWLLRKGIFLQDPTKEKVNIGRAQPELLVEAWKSPSPEVTQENGKCCHLHLLTSMDLEHKTQKNNKKDQK